MTLLLCYYGYYFEIFAFELKVVCPGRGVLLKIG